jgi:D-alanine-D-alanine ligase
MRIAITYNADAAAKPHIPLAELDGAGDPDPEPALAGAASDVHAALAGGHTCATIPVGADQVAALQAVRAFAPDVVFNLCEGMLGRSAWDTHLVLALELLGIPCCGADAVTIALAQDKALMRNLLRRIGVRTPDGFVAAIGRPEDPLRRDLAGLLASAGRIIIKPSREDAGVGIDGESVVGDVEAALAACRRVWTTHRQAALVEAFLDGSEYNLGIYVGPDGPVLLPPGQIVYAHDLAPGQRVVGWRAKWDAASPEHRTTPSCIVRDLPPGLRAEITTICRRIATTLGLTGYFRFDLRVGPDGRVHVLDLNANPDLAEGSGFRKALAAAGVRFEQFLADMIAMRRPHARPEPLRSTA